MLPASRGPTLPSTASRITADKQRTGNARRTENPSQPTLSGNRGRAADPTASAMTGGSFQRHGEFPKRKRGATEYRTMRCLARPKAPPYMKDGGDGYTKGEARASLSYIDVPRLSDERAGSAGTYFTGFPWLSTTTRSPRPSERTPANCVLASPTMTIVIRSKSIYCPITCLASSRVISLSVCSLRLT